MRKITIILFLITLLSSNLIAQYKVMVSDNYPPYNFINEQGDLVGFNIEILNAIADIYETDIELTGGNWKYINSELDNGNINAIAGEHFPGSLEKDFIYSRSAINTSHCFLYNKNYNVNFSLEKFRSLKQPMVAMWDNNVLIHYIQSINPTTKFLFINSYEELINSLDNEDITCIFAQRVGSIYQAYKHHKEYIRPLNHRILERNMGFKVSNDSPELAEILNNGLEVILANGEYQRIYDKWIQKYNKDYNNWNYYLKYILIVGVIITSLFLFLVIFNWILRSRIRIKTSDLKRQLGLNSKIMLELEKQKIKAEESDRMKSAFLANMSHEIRTPMNGILGFTHLLSNTDYSFEKRKQFIDIIQQSGNRMLGTINNIIDVSKLESGIEKPNYKKIFVEEILEELLNFFTPETNEKGIELILTKSGDSLSSDFYTDEYKLNSILTNLIKNAIKFTKEGQISITFSLKNEYAEFWISDTGIGIAKEKQAAVFGQFVQADNSYSRGYEGSGLGLSITQGYVDILNGEITLESVPQKGTTFYVKIPNNLPPTIKETIIPKKVIPEAKVSDKYKILVAEDDETSFFFLEHILSNIANPIIHACDGSEAIDLFNKNQDTDIILMDIKMPNKNGFEATREIRKINKNIYIIAQTAYAQPEDKEKIMNSGFNAYIEKPVDKDKLLELINKVKDYRST